MLRIITILLRPYRNILVATDGSVHSNAALSEAIAIAKRGKLNGKSYRKRRLRRPHCQGRSLSIAMV
jgi:hypothetical protein